MCQFCNELNYWKEYEPDKNKFKTKYFAKLSIYTWKKEQRAIKGTQKSTTTSRAYDLNYCPMCGRKLVE